MGNAVRRLWREDSGATSIEYAFIASLIALAIFATVATIAAPLNNTFTSLATNL